MSLIWDPRGANSWREREGRWQIDSIKYPSRTVFLLSKIEFGTGTTVAVVDSFWDARQEAAKRTNSREVRAAKIYGEIRDLERRLGNERNEVRTIERRLTDARNEVRAIERCCY